jgi:hypothetical protein
MKISLRMTTKHLHKKDNECQVFVDFLLYHQEYIPQLAELLWKEWEHFYLYWNICDLEGMKNELLEYCKADTFPTTFVAIFNGKIAGIAILGDDVVPNAPLEPWSVLLCLPQNFLKSKIIDQTIINQFIRSPYMKKCVCFFYFAG